MMSNAANQIDTAIEGAERSGRIAGLLRATSRTFALSIEGLPDGLREQIAVSYLVLRVSDYLEDHETLGTDEKVKLLASWEEVLRPLGDVDADRAAEREAPAVERFAAMIDAVPHRVDDPEAGVALGFRLLVEAVRSFAPRVREAIIDRVCATTRGMARWQGRGPDVATEDDLDDYMHQVAGLVGYLVTDLFSIHFASVGRRRHLLMPLAREFGLALQCVNILRGLRKDYERGWVFVPQSFCAAYDLLAADLFRRSEQNRAMRVVADLVAKSERHLKAGLEYVRLLPRRLHRVRLACMWPLLFAARTIAVSRDNPAVLTGEVKISRATVKRIVGFTSLFGWSNLWLDGYAHHLLGSRAAR